MQQDGQNRNSLHIASAAGTAKGAVKTGKTLAGMTKGAAAGPYGLIAAGLWENRKVLAGLIAAIATLFLLPVLYIAMLPSLIFGNNGIKDVPDKVMNDNTVILQNIAETEGSIEEILRKKHNALIDKINKEGSRLGKDCEYGITDDFADQIIYQSSSIISQFCASTGNYNDINLKQLKKLLDQNSDGLFSCTVSVTDHEETDEKTGKTNTVHHYEYTVVYGGDTYFAEKVFALTPGQASIASAYADNLHLFLFDSVYQIEYNLNLTPGETGSDAVVLAMTKLGTPYSQELRNQDDYFDCSSFSYWVYEQLGINLSYDGANTAAAQGRYIVENGLAIPYENLAPGDLIFYSYGINNRYMNIDHVAIYAGEGYVVDASIAKHMVAYRPIFGISNIVLCGRPYAKSNTP